MKNLKLNLNLEPLPVDVLRDLRDLLLYVDETDKSEQVDHYIQQREAVEQD